MNNRIDSDAVCPFYLRHGRSERVYSVTCEPIMSPKQLGFEVVQRVGFFKRSEFESYVDMFCCDRYEECPVYIAIYQNRIKEAQRGKTQKKKRKV